MPIITLNNDVVQHYLRVCEGQYQEFVNGVKEIDRSKSGGVFSSNDPKRFTICGVAYTKKQAFGVLERIENRMKGLNRYIDKIESKEWLEVHDSIIQQIADSDFSYHNAVDAKYYIHFLDCSSRALNTSTSRELSSKRMYLQETYLSYQSYLEDVLKKEVDDSSVKQRWIQNRALELCAFVDFDVIRGQKGGVPCPCNVDAYDEFQPLDVLVYGDAKISDLKRSGHYRNMFQEARDDITRQVRGG